MIAVWHQQSPRMIQSSCVTTRTSLSLFSSVIVKQPQRQMSQRLLSLPPSPPPCTTTSIHRWRSSFRTTAASNIIPTSKTTTTRSLLDSTMSRFQRKSVVLFPPPQSRCCTTAIMATRGNGNPTIIITTTTTRNHIHRHGRSMMDTTRTKFALPPPRGSFRCTSTSASATTCTPTTMTIEPNPCRRIGHYLFGVAGLVVAMISIGGITRLTQSGLSMTSWTLTGSIPPLTLAQWQEEFRIYQQYPEYQQRTSMTLSEFQYIYFWEYGHRMMGRLIGLAYIVPYLYFTVTRQIPKGYHPRFVLMGSIGLLQGYVGWWMVQSGLTEDRFQDTHEIRVKPLRLTTHLFMAITTYSLLLTTALDMVRYPLIHNNSGQSPAAVTPPPTLLKDLLRVLSRGSIAVMTMTMITILSGALVAGNDAGRAYNTFPKMNDEWFPSNYFGEREDDDDDGTAPTKMTSTPWSMVQNFYENTATVQFNHRFCGMTTALSGAVLSLYGLYRFMDRSTFPKVNPSTIMSSPSYASSFALLPQVRTGLMAMGIAVTGQFTLGVTTLLTHVPISLAASHQIGSIVVLTSSIYLYHTTRTILKRVPAISKTISTAAATTTTTAMDTRPHSILSNPLLVRQLSTRPKSV